jgi:hypothetical protein
MWHLTNIPKIVHFYWGNEKLSYLRYMSVYSFRKLNPDWKIKIHVPEALSMIAPTWGSDEQKNAGIEKDYWTKLNDLNVEIVKIPPFDNFDNNAHEVHKSDYYRWTLLCGEGGVWSDIDIIYINPMNNMLENVPQEKNIDTGFSRYAENGKYAISFMLASAGNTFFKKIHELSNIHYDANRYQSIGSELINNNWHRPGKLRKQNLNCFLLMNEKCVYPISPNNIPRFFDPLDDELKAILADSNVLGLHWFAGYPKSQQFESAVDESNVEQFDNILSAAIKQTTER